MQAFQSTAVDCKTQRNDKRLIKLTVLVEHVSVWCDYTASGTDCTFAGVLFRCHRHLVKSIHSHILTATTVVIHTAI